MADKIKMLRAFAESLESNDALLKSSILEGIDAYADSDGNEYGSESGINVKEARQNLEAIAGEVFSGHDILECRAVCEFLIEGQMPVDTGSEFEYIPDGFVEKVNDVLGRAKDVEHFDEAYYLDDGMLTLRFKGHLSSANAGELVVSLKRAKDIVAALAKQENKG